LISDAVLATAVKLQQSLYENEEFELDIPFIHLTYSLVQARLINFSELVHAVPDLVQTLLTKRDQLDVGEMILDVVALKCCLEQLEPRREDLKNANSRLVWCNRVQCIRPIIQVMKSLISRPSQQQLGNGDSEARFIAQLFGERSVHHLQNCRIMWIRLDVVRMFIEHTCPPGQSTHPTSANNAFLLWTALGENIDFSTVHTMTAIERFLKSRSDEMRERLIRFDISRCEICKSPLHDPVQMPCEHICCMSCAKGWFHKHNICPMCRKEVGGDFKVKISQKCRRALETYNSFRNRCKSFFMELVSVYCFGEQLPNPDLVQKFIGYVIRDEKRTEDFTPFGGQGIDVTPVIRSYILQQLLAIKEREKEVYKHLEEYLHRARGLAEQGEHLIEVCVLCVQCMEDVETVKLLKAKGGGENVQIILASQVLERTLRTIHGHQNSLNINCLRDIAGIRAALDVLSTYLGDDFAENVKRFQALRKCLETAKYLCSDSSRSVLQLFLLKQLVRHDPNGIDAVKERCKRTELKWIMPPQLEVMLFLLL
ncbi:E3 ubiquitin- ligase rnf213-alpha-like, partial [Paramuricea clavata]